MDNSGSETVATFDVVEELRHYAARTPATMRYAYIGKGWLSKAADEIEALRKRLDLVRDTIDFAKGQGALNEVTYDVLRKAATDGF